MAKVAPFFSTHPLDVGFYHDNDECPAGREIASSDLAAGMGRAGSLCAFCEVWDRAQTEADYEPGQLDDGN